MSMDSGRLHCSRRGASPGAKRGFTLIELMIVVAIIAILAVAAMSAYGFATRKSNRAAAQGCLTERAHFMERFFATNLQYHQTTAGVAVVLPVCSTDISRAYDQGALGSGFAVAPTATTFTLEVRPIGGQLKDTDCGTSLTINQVGTKVPTTSCW